MRADMALIAGAALAYMAVPTAAQAGPLGDELTRCVIASATEADKQAVNQWMFAAMTANPVLKSYSSLSDAQRIEFSTSFARTMQRLVQVDCEKQASAAVKDEGMGVVEIAMNGLSAVAGRELLTSPESMKSMQAFAPFIDKPQWDILIRSAGTPAK